MSRSCIEQRQLEFTQYEAHSRDWHHTSVLESEATDWRLRYCCDGDGARVAPKHPRADNRWPLQTPSRDCPRATK